ncbi:MAG: hypothetical protein J4G05_06035 [Chlorobi bacterium]|nr:hypothetical protein [Chlorobiota bacterium]
MAESLFENFQGSPDAWIVILAEPWEEVVFEGGREAWQVIDVAWLSIKGF